MGKGDIFTNYLSMEKTGTCLMKLKVSLKNLLYVIHGVGIVRDVF